MRIQKRDETLDYAWQTSYGISERVIASIIAFHSDEKGLILPSIVAPLQVVVIPIPSVAERYKEILEYSEEVYKMLKNANIRVKLDDREDLRPVDKYFEWELKGVPLRIEIGIRELENRIVTIFRRDELKRIIVKLDNLVDNVMKLLSEIDENLRKRAWEWFNSKIRTFNTLNEAVEHIRNHGGIAQIPWCGDENCALRAIEELEGIAALGSPVSAIEKIEVTNTKCGICGKNARTYLRIAKRY